MKSYKVWLGSKHIDTVLWLVGSEREELKRILVTRDGYDPNIRVTQERKRKSTTKKVRLIIMGKPNSRRTSRFATFPRPMVLLAKELL